jgi:hypothetical protein
MYCVQWNNNNILFRTRKNADRHVRRLEKLGITPRLGVRTLPLLGENFNLRFYAECGDVSPASGWFVLSNEHNTL